MKKIDRITKRYLQNSQHVVLLGVVKARWIYKDISSSEAPTLITLRTPLFILILKWLCFQPSLFWKKCYTELSFGFVHITGLKNILNVTAWSTKCSEIGMLPQHCYVALPYNTLPVIQWRDSTCQLITRLMWKIVSCR